MNIETLIKRPIIRHTNRVLPTVILSWIQDGLSLRQIHKYLPGATWALIADTIYEAYWRKLFSEALRR